jgi:magnesium-transporting ATPase (P-type)
MRIVTLRTLQVEEAALSGESVPVEKQEAPVAADAVLGDRTCMVYNGTLVTSGTATAVVTGTGMTTELGRISNMIDSAVSLDPLVAVSILMTTGTITLFDMDYRQTLAAAVAPDLALARAQTIAVTFVIFFQIFYMIHCRSLKDNVGKIGWFSNLTVFWGIGLVLVLQALFIYLPFFQEVFQTAALSFKDLALTAAASFAIFSIISLEKWIRSLPRTRIANSS